MTNTNNKINTNPYIFQYVYNSHRDPVGVVLAVKDMDEVVISCSRANKTAGDMFDRRLGFDIAMQRALKRSNPNIPNSFNDEIIAMLSRASRYFKVSFNEIKVAGIMGDV